MKKKLKCIAAINCTNKVTCTLIDHKIKKELGVCSEHFEIIAPAWLAGTITYE